MRGLKVALPYATQDAAHLDIPKRVTVTLAADGEVYLQMAPEPALPSFATSCGQWSNTNKLTVIIAGDRSAQLQPLVSVLDTLKGAGIGSASIIAKQE